MYQNPNDESNSISQSSVERHVAHPTLFQGAVEAEQADSYPRLLNFPHVAQQLQNNQQSYTH